MTRRTIATSILLLGIATADTIRIDHREGTTGNYSPVTLTPVQDHVITFDAGGTPIIAAQSGSGVTLATDTLWDAVGDLVVGSGLDTAVRLAKGTALQVLRVNAAGTALEWAAASGGAGLADNNVFTGSNTFANVTAAASSVWNLSAATVSLGAISEIKLPTGTDPDIAVEGCLSYDTNGDVLRAFDGTAQVAIGRKIEAIHCTVVLPNDLADSERDAFWMWENVSGMSFVVTGWKGKSDTDNTTLNIEEINEDGTSNTVVDAVEIATDGTGLFYGSDTTITAATIETGHLLTLDFDDTDVPGQVKMTVYGHFLSDVP